MKKLFILTAISVMSVFASNAQMAYFIKSSAPLNGAETNSDSVYIDQPDLVVASELSGGGSQLTYFRANKRSSVNVKEQVGDSAWTFASFSTVISTNAALTSITVAGVNISGAVTAKASTGATILAIRDSIIATTSSPNYTATADTTTGTLTITPTADSTATPNGRIVTVTYAGTATPSSGILSGGFYRRNLSTIYGAQNVLFEVSQVGNTQDVLINKSRVSVLDGDAPTTVWYHGFINDNIEVSENRATILSTMNALP